MLKIRRVCPSLLLALLIPIAAYSQVPAGSWRPLPNAPFAEGRHDDVFFVNASLGWIANTAGEIFKTTDGGESWIRQLHDETDLGYRVFFRSIGFANEQVGWAGNLGFTNNPNTEHVLFETRDGGTSWTDITERIAGPRPAGICGLWVVSEQTIYGVGRWNGPPTFIKSVDGGLSWTSVDLRPVVTGLVDVYFFNEDIGLIVGGNGVGSSLEEQNASRTVILYTADGGATWEPRYTSETLGKWGWKFSFPTPETGYVATQGPTFDGIILKTTDGGSHWEEKVVGDSLGFSGIGFATAQRGWVGSLATHETTDGGETWHEVSDVGERINRFRMLGDTLGYAVGRQVYKYTASTATNRASPSEVPPAFRLEQNYPNPFNPSTTIAYTLLARANVKITVQDLLGRRIATLVDERQAPGVHRAHWDGTDERGVSQPSTVYFYRLAAGAFVQTKKMVLLR